MVNVPESFYRDVIDKRSQISENEEIESVDSENSLSIIEENTSNLKVSLVEEKSLDNSSKKILTNFDEIKFKESPIKSI